MHVGHRHVIARLRGLALALTAVVAASCATSTAPVTAPAPTAVPNITVPPSDAPPTIDPGSGQFTEDVLLRAVDALRQLDSYRYAKSNGAGLAGGTESGVVVMKEGVLRAHITRNPIGSLPGEFIQIGQQRWASTAGSAWSLEDLPDFQDDGGEVAGEEPGGPVDVPDEVMISMPLDDLEYGIGGPPTLSDLGLEDLAGTPVHHWAGRTDGKPFEMTLADGSSVSGEGGWAGTMDVWISEPGGYLVALRVEGRDTSVPADADPAQLAFAKTFVDVRISGIDDPQNVVEEPVVPDPTPKPTGHPEVIALFKRAEAASAGVTAWQLTMDDSQGAGSSHIVETVVREPVYRSSMVVTGDGVFQPSTMVVVGDEAWSQASDGTWTPLTTAQAACQGSVTIGECLRDRQGGPEAGMLAPPETFTLVGPETLDGVATIHVHSDGGLGSFGASIPGTSDVWFDADGGWIVRSVFAGTGLSNRTDVTRVNDLTLTVERPVP